MKKTHAVPVRSSLNPKLRLERRNGLQRAYHKCNRTPAVATRKQDHELPNRARIFRANALISAAKRNNVLVIVRVLDQERQKGKLRSLFYGILIILKDSFVTVLDLGMSITLDRVCLSDLRCRRMES